MLRASIILILTCVANCVIAGTIRMSHEHPNIPLNRVLQSTIVKSYFIPNAADLVLRKSRETGELSLLVYPASYPTDAEPIFKLLINENDLIISQQYNPADALHNCFLYIFLGMEPGSVENKPIRPETKMQQFQWIIDSIGRIRLSIDNFDPPKGLPVLILEKLKWEEDSFRPMIEHIVALELLRHGAEPDLYRKEPSTDSNYRLIIDDPVEILEQYEKLLKEIQTSAMNLANQLRLDVQISYDMNNPKWMIAGKVRVDEDAADSAEEVELSNFIGTNSIAAVWPNRDLFYGLSYDQLASLVLQSRDKKFLTVALPRVSWKTQHFASKLFLINNLEDNNPDNSPLAAVVYDDDVVGPNYSNEKDAVSRLKELAYPLAVWNLVDGTFVWDKEIPVKTAFQPFIPNLDHQVFHSKDDYYNNNGLFRQLRQSARDVCINILPIRSPLVVLVPDDIGSGLMTIIVTELYLACGSTNFMVASFRNNGGLTQSQITFHDLPVVLGADYLQDYMQTYIDKTTK